MVDADHGEEAQPKTPKSRVLDQSSRPRGPAARIEETERAEEHGHAVGRLRVVIPIIFTFMEAGFVVAPLEAQH